MTNFNLYKNLPENLAGLFTRTAGKLLGYSICSILLFPIFLHAEPPTPFSANYEARYGGFKASAERTLQLLDAENIQLNTNLKLELLGQTVSSIMETSSVTIDRETGLSKSMDYSFIQSGIGKRSRHINFDWNNSLATATQGNQEIELPLASNVRDTLSAYLEIRDQLLKGHSDIVFHGIYKGELEEIHYRVAGEEELSTAIGNLNTIKLQRIREPGSERSTEIWLALDWDYLLVKLVQEEPGNSTIKLDLREAIMADTLVSPAPDTLPAASG